MNNRKFINVCITTALVILLVAKITSNVVNFSLLEEYKTANENYSNLLHKALDRRELWGTDQSQTKNPGVMLTPGMAINDIKSIGLESGDNQVHNLGDTEAIVRVDGTEYPIQPSETIMVYLKDNSLIAVEKGYLTFLQ